MAVNIFEPIRLTEEMKKDLVQMEANMRVLEREIEKAEKTGFDIADMKERFEKMKKLRSGLLKNYA